MTDLPPYFDCTPARALLDEIRARRDALPNADRREFHVAVRELCAALLETAQVDDDGGCPLCRS